MVDETTTTSNEPKNKRKRTSDVNVRNGERTSQKGRKLKQYVLEEKLDIIDYAKVIGNRAAGREFNVAESSIREWRKNEQRLRTMFETAPERSRLDGGGRRPVCEDLEKSLLLYVASTSATESPLTWHSIKQKANDLWNEICKRDSDVKEKDFSANMGWVARFIKRNNIQLAAPSPSSSSSPSCSSSTSSSSSSTASASSPNLNGERSSTEVNKSRTIEADSSTTNINSTNSTIRNQRSSIAMVQSSPPNPPSAAVMAVPTTSAGISITAVNGNTTSGNTTSGNTTSGNTTSSTAEVISPKRRRKNFTPKKLVEHTIVESKNILLETISECDCESKPTNNASSTLVNNQLSPSQNVTVIAVADEDENIDVCF